MSIPFDNAVGTLEAMFPDWEKETLTTLLISNSYHVERTIEMVLSMQGDVNPSSEIAPSVEPNFVSKTYDIYKNLTCDKVHIFFLSVAI